VEAVTFRTPDGIRLEGEVRLDAAAPVAAAVICHAHPRHGGSKDHPVLWSLRNELAGGRSYLTLSFNFRGTMGSSGTFGGGRAEVRDVDGAIGYVAERAPGVPLLLAGWSFGAAVALHAAIRDERPRALASIGLPLRPGDVEVPIPPAPEELRRRRTPALFVAGSEDEYCPADELRAYAAAAGGDALIVDGTDHYLWRREREAAAAIAEWAVGALGLGSA
jgi:alpha/beta superfamily hydrolase